MIARSIQARYGEVARARSVKTAFLRTIVEANVPKSIAPEEQDRLRELILDKIERGVVDVGNSRLRPGNSTRK